MNALRRLCIWSLVLCATFLAGCGSKDLPSSSSDIAGADLRIAIMSTSDQELSDCVAINNKIRQYMGNKNAKIATYKYAYPAASQRYIDEILNDLASEDAPDIIYVPSRALAQMLDDAGAIMALDKVVKDNISGFDTLLYKSATLIARGHGHIIGIPINLDPVMVAYNKNHFQKAQVQADANWSWSQFAETSTRIMAANNPGGYIGAGVLDRSVYSWLPFVYSNGGGYIEDYTINVQSPNTVYALEWMQTHIKNGNLTYMTSMQDALRNETVSFGLSLVSNVNSLNSKKAIYRTLPVPKSPKTGQSITIVSGALFVVNAQAKNLDLIVDFLKASLDTQAQQYIATKTGTLPVRKDAQFPSLTWMPERKVLDAVLESGRPIPQPVIGDNSVWVLDFQSLASGSSSAEKVAEAAAIELQKIVNAKDIAVEPKSVEPFFGPVSMPQQEPPAKDFKETKVHWVTNNQAAIQLANAFNKTRKDIYVSVKLIDGFNEKGLDERSISDGSADIVDLPINIREIQSYVVTNKILALDRYLESESAYHSSGFANAIKYEGKTYAIPLERSPLLIFADREVWKQIGTPFPKSGWQWDDFLTWANKSATTSYAKNGVVFGASVIWNEVYQQKGGQWNECSPELLKSTLSLLMQLYGSYPSGAYVLRNPSINDVTKGKAAAYIGRASNAKALNQGERDTLDKAGIIALPFPTATGKQTGTGTVTDYIVLSAKAPHPDEAAQFMKWLVSKEASLVYANYELGRFPAVMYKDNYYPYSIYWGSQAESLFPLEFFQVSSLQINVSMSIDEMVNKYLHGELSIDNAVDNIISRVKEQ